jgi:hypothetical protein
MERDMTYEKNNIGFDDHYREEDGGGIKCKNYELCQCILPTWWFDCKDNYLCTNCHMLFGTWGTKDKQYKTGKGVLEIVDTTECPVCLENRRSITQPNCQHTICIECFKRSYYGDDDTKNEPKFPYPDIEDEYDEDQFNEKWEIDYPLITIYNQEHNKWNDEKDEKYHMEEYLRNCPLCRA